MNKCIDKRQIDEGLTSVEVGLLPNGNKLMARIDKLSFVSSARNPENESKLAECLDQLKGDFDYGIRRPNKAKHHRKVMFIKSRKNKLISLRIEYEPKRNIGFIRMELSPQHIGCKAMNDLFSWLASPERCGVRVYNVLKASWVTRVDFALDLYGYSLNDFYLNLKGTRKGTVFSDENSVTGIRLGSVKSPLCVSNYDKVTPVGEGNTEDNDLTTMDVLAGSYERFTRIELRIKPMARSMMLKDLIFLNNPLKGVSLYNRDLKYDSGLLSDFTTELDKGTIPSALSKLTGSSRAVRKSRKAVLGQMPRYEMKLFNSDKVWSYWRDCLEQMGVLGQPQYWEERNRRRKR
jgi:hypothetical protein